MDTLQRFLVVFLVSCLKWSVWVSVCECVDACLHAFAHVFNMECVGVCISVWMHV